LAVGARHDARTQLDHGAARRAQPLLLFAFQALILKMEIPARFAGRESLSSYLLYHLRPEVVVARGRGVPPLNTHSCASSAQET
jgi:hypothetical protein